MPSGDIQVFEVQLLDQPDLAKMEIKVDILRHVPHPIG